MDITTVFLILSAAIVLFGMVLAIWFSTKKRWLTASSKTKYRKEMDARSNGTAMEKILFYDIVLHHILDEMGLKWNFVEKMRTYERFGKPVEMLWQHHKLRNKLAHELHRPKDDKLEAEAKRYRQEIERHFL